MNFTSWLIVAITLAVDVLFIAAVNFIVKQEKEEEEKEYSNKGKP